MMKLKFIKCTLLCVIGILTIHAQLKTTVLIQSTLEDEKIDISIDKSVYFSGDTVLLVIGRYDSARTARITPMLSIEGVTFKSIGRHKYVSVIPLNVTPGLYPVSLRVTDSEGRRFRYETDCVVSVEEYQDVERLSRFISIIPEPGGNTIRTAVTMDRKQVRNLQVRFERDSIRLHMGPQFVRITTTIISRDGASTPSYERRVLTYRSHGDPNKDHAMFIQYRTAYGTYANIRPKELEQVLVPVDSLPGWVILKVSIEPDYTIRIGAYDRSNSVTRYFRVRGPTIEIGFSLGIPKVLYDTQAKDTIDYGNTSAMLRFYYVNSESGNRFPVSLGMGTFGGNSPIDVSIGRGGFAVSTFLDLVELTRIHDLGFIKKVNVGLELTQFFPIQRKARLLVNAQVGFSL